MQLPLYTIVFEDSAYIQQVTAACPVCLKWFGWFPGVSPAELYIAWNYIYIYIYGNCVLPCTYILKPDLASDLHVAEMQVQHKEEHEKHAWEREILIEDAVCVCQEFQPWQAWALSVVAALSPLSPLRKTVWGLISRQNWCQCWASS